MKENKKQKIELNDNKKEITCDSKELIDLNNLIDTQQEDNILNYLLENHKLIDFSTFSLRRKFILIELFSIFVLNENKKIHENIFLLNLLKQFLDQNSELNKLVEYKTLLNNLKDKLKHRCDLSKIYRLRGQLL